MKLFWGSCLWLFIGLVSSDVCHLEHGLGQIDLSPVAQTTFTSLTPAADNSTTYYLHLCNNSKSLPDIPANDTIKNDCLDSVGYSLCRRTISITNGTATSKYEKLGENEQSYFNIIDDGVIYIAYRKDSNVTIALVCTKNVPDSIFALQGTNLFFYSPHACFHEAPHEGHSTGAIILLLVAIFMLVYFVGGYFFRYFAYGFRGVEAFPHHEFWTDLPALVREGMVFVQNGCRVIPTPDSYESI